MRYGIPLLVLGLAAAAPGAAQEERPRRPPAPAATPEGILALRARLGLTPGQIERLTALRQEAVSERQARLGRMLELRSRLGAGDLTRDEFLAQARSERESLRSRRTDRQERIGAVLTAPQREQLIALRRDRLSRARASWHERGRVGPPRRAGWMGERPGMRRSGPPAWRGHHHGVPQRPPAP
jgi:Spy/CpxP family protein refolding chaperone